MEPLLVMYSSLCREGGGGKRGKGKGENNNSRCVSYVVGIRRKTSGERKKKEKERKERKGKESTLCAVHLA